MGFDPQIVKRIRLGLCDDQRHLVIRSAAGKHEVNEYSFGIEEEYFLADAATLEVANRTPDQLFEAANWSTGGRRRTAKRVLHENDPEAPVDRTQHCAQNTDIGLAAGYDKAIDAGPRNCWCRWLPVQGE